MVSTQAEIGTIALRDVFLCHAWDDRKGIVKELHELLKAKGVSVWFSEKDFLFNSNLMREIDKGLAKYDVLRNVSPLLGSRNGLDTAKGHIHQNVVGHQE